MSKKKKAAKAVKKNHSKIRETFSQVFNEKIATAGFSIAELAEISSISKAQLYDYKRGTKSPTVDSLDLLSAAFKCEPADFLKPSNGAARSAPKAPAKKAEVSAKPSKGSAKPSKISAKPSKGSAKASKKSKPKKHKAAAHAVVATPKSDEPMGSSSDDASPQFDMDTPAGMDAANDASDTATAE